MNGIATSIIIPAHGHEGMTRHCVNAVLATIGARSDVEVIVVDDASPEPITLDPGADARARVERSEANLKFSGACNLGAAAARGGLLVFLNNDTEPHAGWLEAMEACAASDASIAVVGARLL